MPTQRELEMARGAEVAARHAAEELYRHGIDAATAEVLERREVLQRWIEARKMRIVTTEANNNTAWVADVPVCSERAGPAFPSVSYIAQVGLAIGALDSFDGVQEQSVKKRDQTMEDARKRDERKRRDEYRKHQDQWRRFHEPHTLK